MATYGDDVERSNRPYPQSHEKRGELRSRNGRIFVDEVLPALRQGEMLYHEAATTLNVRVDALGKVTCR